ncbi:L-rhamnose mutarotase [Dawidia soli]|uniref:L-rhamnose mutarotase n=1 Tax=Dawidia soli TaxID=2782352 RepID=A0AAP2DBG7_9BACT|nr:L-rhamnose mutarotase [Dawidia soli]MBT1686247.1 L-rhamnose mutarotase [Dawidia soli]
MKRIAFKMKLKPGYRAEYTRRHAALWPEVKALLQEAGVHDYSIFFDEDTDTLFAVQKVDGAAGSQALGNQDVIRRWWAYMADIMETNPDQSPISKSLPEVFYLP